MMIRRLIFKGPLLPKYWLRPLTKRMDKVTLLRLVQRAVPLMLPVSRFLGNIPVAGRWLKRLVPVADYAGIYPLTRAQLAERAVLDTFDWLSPVYDNPQTAVTVRRWAEQAGLHAVEVLKAGYLVVRGQTLR
jgi:hypothetical protein